jgi:putative glutamine amidotransferase
VSGPRIAVSGVVRHWDGAERTGVNSSYLRSVLAAGGMPILLSPLIGAARAAAALEGAEALLLTGGEDIDPSWYGQQPSPHLGRVDRERDLFELALFASARQRELPILGICRGIQLINVALGGTLWQDLATERAGPLEHDSPAARNARVHTVDLVPGSRAAEALGTLQLEANSFHHQGVRETAGKLVASGRAADGLVEAVESAPGTPWLLAVQWHPEEMHAEAAARDHGLFRSLISATRARA